MYDKETEKFYDTIRTLSSSRAVVRGTGHSTLFSIANLSKNLLASKKKKSKGIKLIKKTRKLYNADIINMKWQYRIIKWTNHRFQEFQLQGIEHQAFFVIHRKYPLFEKVAWNQP